MAYRADAIWEKVYRSATMSYPAEGVIRIFKGHYPNLFMPMLSDHPLSILDVGCGDGRHLHFLSCLGYDVSGIEISKSICDMLTQRMRDLNVPASIKKGHSSDLPFSDSSFDRLLTWNSCYYMSHAESNFEEHVDEFARVLRPNGWIVVSVPKKSNFIFHKSIPAVIKGYRIIQEDYFDGERNGEIMRCFDSSSELINSFQSKFTNFSQADIHMDWFGLPYHWHVFCAQRR